jgi:hypothetical protein
VRFELQALSRIAGEFPKLRSRSLRAENTDEHEQAPTTADKCIGPARMFVEA